MRTAFVDALTELASRNKEVYLISADMGFSVFEEFQKKFPDRFLNLGISESNVAGVAAGLALTGNLVYIYSFASFITMRCFEQIRLDICYHKANVKIIGLGGGLTYALDGPTHHATEDIAIMRALPDMVVLCPADPVETKLAIEASSLRNGPCYIRIGKKGEGTIHQKKIEFEIGKGIVVREGDDLTIIATGNMLQNAVSASKSLEGAGISARVVSMHTVKPLDRELILSCASDTGIVFTLEEHGIIGGLGSAVAEVLAESGSNCFFRRMALPDRFFKEVGNQEYLRSISSLTPSGIHEVILKEYTGFQERRQKCKS